MTETKAYLSDSTPLSQAQMEALQKANRTTLDDGRVLVKESQPDILKIQPKGSRP